MFSKSHADGCHLTAHRRLWYVGFDVSLEFLILRAPCLVDFILDLTYFVAAEVAWVTHAGNTPLEKKIAIRPTSETVCSTALPFWM